MSSLKRRTESVSVLVAVLVSWGGLHDDADALEPRIGCRAWHGCARSDGCG
jgi:hypothetical protein